MIIEILVLESRSLASTSVLLILLTKKEVTS